MIAEPGRYIAGDAGIIQSEVVLVTTKSGENDRRWIFLDIGKFGGLPETLEEAIQYRITTPHDGGQPVKWSWQDQPAMRLMFFMMRPVTRYRSLSALETEFKFSVRVPTPQRTLLSVSTVFLLCRSITSDAFHPELVMASLARHFVNP